MTVPIMRENKRQVIKFRFFETTRSDKSPKNFIFLVLNFFPNLKRSRSPKQQNGSHKITRTCVCSVKNKTALAKQNKTQSKLHQDFKPRELGTDRVQYFTSLSQITRVWFELSGGMPG